MDELFREHSSVVREQAATEAVVLPLAVPDALRPVLLRFPKQKAARPWWEVMDLHQRGAPWGGLFAGVEDAELATLLSIFDFYCFPLEWSDWVAQEQHKRGLIATPPPSVTAAAAKLRDVLVHACGWERTDPRLSFAARPPFVYDVALAFGRWCPHRCVWAWPKSLQVRDLRADSRERTAPCRVLAAAGDVQGLVWARSQGYTWSKCNRRAVLRASAPLDTKHWRLRGMIPSMVSTSSLAAFSGNVAVLELMAGDVDAPPFDEDSCWAAALGGHRHVLEWLRRAGCPWDQDTYMGAVEKGDVDLMRWVAGAGCPLDEDTAADLAGRGHLVALQIAREAGCPWNESACTEAARSGHLATLQWLVGAGCPRNESACTEAASSGHFATLQWLVGAGCPMSSEACTVAALGGHLEVLQWLVRVGCPWDAHTFTMAIFGGRRAVVEWLLAADCPHDESVCREAASEGRLAILQLLIAAGCKWNKLECLRAARVHEHTAIAGAAASGATAAWILQQVPRWQRAWYSFWAPGVLELREV